MPRILYRPDAKKYNAIITDHALAIVQRDTGLSQFQIATLINFNSSPDKIFQLLEGVRDKHRLSSLANRQRTYYGAI